MNANKGQGGTSVSTGLPWKWLALAVIGIVVGAVILVGIAKNDPDLEANTVSGNDTGDSGDKSQGDDSVDDDDEGHDRAPGDSGGDGAEDDGALAAGFERTTENGEPGSIAEHPAAGSVAGNGAPSVETLLQILVGEDSLEARRAAIALDRAGERAQAVVALVALMRRGDFWQLRQAKDILGEWKVPQTYDRSVLMEPPDEDPSDITWREWSAEVEDDDVIAGWQVYYGEEIFGAELPPWIEVSVAGGSLDTPIRRRFEPVEGINERRETIVRGIGPGTYDVSILLWGQNRNTKTQLNKNGTTLTVQKP